MQFADRYIETAEKIIGSYDGLMPLQHFLKQLLSANKKYGSKDRKAITHACYCYYRFGFALKELPVKEKTKWGIFLCSENIGGWESLFSEEGLSKLSEDFKTRLAFVKEKYSFNTGAIFPLQNQLSDNIDKEAFVVSHLTQPNLYLRIRPGKEKEVPEKLIANNITYQACGTNCISLANSTKIDKILALNNEAVVQDLSSQRIAELLSAIHYSPSPLKVWDCCAASGGKSILAYDVLKNIDLTVSDVRPSIIQNLKKRFAEAGIKKYKAFVADLTGPKLKVSNSKFQLVICDAPCSGSGTWSRTPEQLYFFSKEKIDHYAQLQKKIVSNAANAITGDGYFLYITCSVFKKENEEIVEFIKANTSLRLVKEEYLIGYDKKADTMFAALFTASTH
jgi:16S rRNA (cytosine967-C5)-methyltransferase